MGDATTLYHEMREERLAEFLDRREDSGFFVFARHIYRHAVEDE